MIFPLFIIIMGSPVSDDKQPNQQPPVPSVTRRRMGATLIAMAPVPNLESRYTHCFRRPNRPRGI